MTSNKGPGSALCRRCRRLVSKGTKVCVHCGTRMPTVGQSRALRGMFDGIDVNTVVMGTCVLMYTGTVMVTANVAPDVLRNPPSWFSIGAPSGQTLVTMGATSGPHLSSGMLWTLLSASYLHGSLLHIGFNLMFIRDLGRIVTDIFGPARYFIIFTVTGVGGFLLSNLGSGALTVGASCSAFGMMGALVVFGWRRGGAAGDAIKSQVLRWAILSVLFTAGMSNVNHWGHAGGFIAGALLAFALPQQEGEEASTGTTVFAVVLALASLGSLAASIFWTATAG